jgi:hypothetical protein
MRAARLQGYPLRAAWARLGPSSEREVSLS